MYALVFKNTVVDIQPAEFVVNADFAWVKVDPSAGIACGWVYENGTFSNPAAPNLATAQALQCHALSSACAAQIISGFASSALGAAHTYASGDIDQQNIVQSAQSTKGGLLSCTDSTGAWSREAHTQAQAQQVLEDFVTARDAARTKLSGLQTQIVAATTVAAVQAISWQEAVSG